MSLLLCLVLRCCFLLPSHATEYKQRLEQNAKHIYAAEIFSGVDMSKLEPEDKQFLEEFLKQSIQEEINAYEEVKKTNDSRILNHSFSETEQSQKVAVEAIKQVAKLKPYKREQMAESLVDIVRSSNGESN